MTSHHQNEEILTPISIHPITAVILAGGQSRRMGQDKALLMVKGVPLIRHTIDTVQSVTQTIFVMTPRIEKYRALVTPDCELVKELSPTQGPLAAFSRILPRINQDWILLLACDLPHLSITALQTWVSYLPDVSDDTVAVLPRHSKGWEPLCGFYHRRCLRSLQAFVQHGGRSFQDWLSQVAVTELPLTDVKTVFNCNTPEDWQKFQSQFP